MIEEEAWADHDSLLGQVQRGRGLGLRTALVTPGAGDLVVECVVQDVRWDANEERGWYFARLVRGLGISLDAIAVDTSAPDVVDSIWFETLVALASGGDPHAAQSLHHAVRYSMPVDVVGDATNRIWADGGAAGRDGLKEAALGRMGAAQMRDCVHPWEDGPWSAWRDVPLVAESLAGWAKGSRPVAPDLSAVGSSELRVTARRHAPADERRAALLELGRRGDPDLLDLAEDSDQRSDLGLVAGLSRALLLLGGVALPRARAWLGSEDRYLRWWAGRTLSEAGTEADGPGLVSRLDSVMADGDWLGVEHLVLGLARIGWAAGIPSIVRMWNETKHSHARVAGLDALIRLGAVETAALAGEAADDCESEVRELARTPFGSAGR